MLRLSCHTQGKSTGGSAYGQLDEELQPPAAEDAEAVASKAV